MKVDGTACVVIGGKLYKRYDAKNSKPAPVGGIPCDKPDLVTGHWPHWIPVGEEPESKWHREAFARYLPPPRDGTYELCGPKVQGNPQRLKKHVLAPHGGIRLPMAPREFGALRKYLSGQRFEGIVWHHPDGRMCKLRRADFGFAWPIEDDGTVRSLG